MPCRIARGCRYNINGYVFPQPDSTSWGRISNGQQLGTNLPIYSPYWSHRWRFSALPDDPYTERLYALEGTELSSLVTDGPDDSDSFTNFDEAKILSVTKTHAWANPRAIEVVFEVFVGN